MAVHNWQCGRAEGGLKGPWRYTTGSVGRAKGGLKGPGRYTTGSVGRAEGGLKAPWRYAKGRHLTQGEWLLQIVEFFSSLSSSGNYLPQNIERSTTTISCAKVCAFPPASTTSPPERLAAL